ncbi:MAG: 6-carboxytetrahydropterin synthase QueD [Planctomycetota bacterium]
MTVTKEFRFDAAHNLVKYQGKCERLHGHTYVLRVTLKGRVNREGMVHDFTDLKRIVGEHVLAKLDHSYINDIIPQSTAENIARWVWEQLEDLPLHEIRLWETPTSYVTYTGRRR